MKAARRRAPKARRCPRCRRYVSLERDFLRPGKWRLATHGPGAKGELFCEPDDHAALMEEVR